MIHDPREPDPHTDANVPAAGLPADDLPGYAEWIDEHNPQMTDEEIDRMFIERMERLEELVEGQRAEEREQQAAADLPILRPITSQVRRIDWSQWPKPAA